MLQNQRPLGLKPNGVRKTSISLEGGRLGDRPHSGLSPFQIETGANAPQRKPRKLALLTSLRLGLFGSRWPHVLKTRFSDRDVSEATVTPFAVSRFLHGKRRRSPKVSRVPCEFLRRFQTKSARFSNGFTATTSGFGSNSHAPSGLPAGNARGTWIRSRNWLNALTCITR